MNISRRRRLTRLSGLPNLPPSNTEPTRQAEISYAVFCLKKKMSERRRKYSLSQREFCLMKSNVKH